MLIIQGAWFDVYEIKLIFFENTVKYKVYAVINNTHTFAINDIKFEIS